MSDFNGLLRAVIENPDDDTVRLVYADALDELPTLYVTCPTCKDTKLLHGSSYGRSMTMVCDACSGTGEVIDTFPAERAELIRVQCELGTHNKPRKRVEGEWCTVSPSELHFYIFGTNKVRPELGERVDVVNTDPGKNERKLFPGVRVTSANMSFYVGVIDAGSVEEDLVRYNELVAREIKLYESLTARGLLTGRETYRRGFVESWCGTAEEWSKVESRLFWHPNQTRKCTGCGTCKPVGHIYTGKDGMKWIECRQPRPCPDSAHPLRKVILTTCDDWHAFLLGNEYSVYSRSQQSLWSSPKWPGLDFDLSSWVNEPYGEGAPELPEYEA